MTSHVDPEVLSGYVLGESGAESSAAIERHLAACANCRRQESELRHLAETFADAPALQPHAGVLDSLLAAQRRLKDNRRRRALQGGLWTAGTVAAVLGIFAVGFWTGRHTSPDAQASKPISLVREGSGWAQERDLAGPHVMFVAAIPDRVAGLAKQDTTTN